MQRRVVIWGTFAAFLLGLWLIIAIWAIREGGVTEKKDSGFDPSMFEKFKHEFPPPDEP
jgi:hypothetical protein